MAASSSSGVRWWRTAFLTLRDETLMSPPPPLTPLLQNLIFSHSESLLSAATDLPPDEVALDLWFLLELVAKASASQDGDAEEMISTSTHACHLIRDICFRVPLQIDSSSWTIILDSFANIVDSFLGIPGSKPFISPNGDANAKAPRIGPVMECLETLRRLSILSHGKSSISVYVHLVKFLLHVIACLHADLVFSYQSSSGKQRSSVDFGNKLSRYCSLWELEAFAFTMLGEAFSAAGSSFPGDICMSTTEVLRKVMDILVSRSLLVQDNVMSRFYASLLHCLHLVLIDPKCSLSDHVSSFVAALRMFFVYGLTSRSQLLCPAVVHKEELGVMNLKLNCEEPKRRNLTPYRPPHLRKKELLSMKSAKVQESLSLSNDESSVVDFTSSDSDYSDSDGSLKDSDNVQSSKVRVAALVCLQDLCQADPKSFTAQWTILLPTNDVLQPRKFEATLMTCLLFDPYLKARLASASTLAAMMDGASSVFLQVAEYKEPTKYGSFMALSNSLGMILVQLHTGILYLIQHESHSRLLASLFKILILLISCTPYSRMPGELLPTVITSLWLRIEEGFPFINDQTGLVVAAISCLTAALSTSPSQPKIRELLAEEISTGCADAERKSGIVSVLFHYSEQLTSQTTCVEALQALRALSHNYPNIISACWEQVSAIVYKVLRAATPEVPARTWKGQIGITVGFVGEKVIGAAIKVLDECLRAISGFKGTEDPIDDKLLDTPFTSECMRMKKVSSAPSYTLENTEDAKEPKACLSGLEQWFEAINRHIPLVLQHPSAMVRTATVTCFAGITSSVFFSLTREKKRFIVSSVTSAALHDEAPPVRSAACRAIGVISCFLEISHSAEVLVQFINAIEINTRDPLVSVRITASWALANICDSLRHCIYDFSLEQCRGSSVDSQLIELLTECALRLTRDGDKVKSNAVRALGNISRFTLFTSSSGVHDKPLEHTDLSLTSNSDEVLPGSSLKGSHGCVSDQYHPGSLQDSSWLEKMVQAFLSCVTTGNVKVQWNVCHAFSNLFLNETIKLQEMDWAPSVFSILLLLLRDSSNFKIRIQAAAALAVPVSALDFGKSFSDVVKGLEHILENLGSDQVSSPSSFKYKVALEKQLTSTMLHVLSLASSIDDQPLKDFLVKKACFLEEWFKLLCSSLGKSTAQTDVGSQKREMISKALRSLAEVCKGMNHHAISQKFEKLNSSMQQIVSQ